MKKIKVLILSCLLFSAMVSYWILEPSHINPAKRSELKLSQSELSIETVNNSFPIQRIRSKMDSIVDNSIIMNDFIGVSSGVYREGFGTYTATAGLKNKKLLKQADKETLHRIASITKSMTAVAVMQLWEQKLIDLNTPIQMYIPEFPKKAKGDITIRQLLNHTSGIKHYSSMWDGISFTHYINSVQALNEFKDRPLSFVPGTDYEYSTYGYTLLGAIIEKVSGLSYQDYMHANVFIPAEMKNTSLEDAKKTYDNKADLYIKLGKTYIKSPKTDLSVKSPGGGVHTTAEDLLKFGRAIIENSLIDSLTLELMMSSYSEEREGVPYGFGWYIDNDEKLGRILYHGGSQSGTSSFFKILLDQKLVVTTLANNFGSDDEVYWLSRDLRNMACLNNSDSLSVNYYKSQSEDVLDKYVGRYSNDESTFVITKEGKQLFSQNKNYPTLPIYSKSKEDFFFRHFDGDIVFEKSNNGEYNLKFIYKNEVNIFRLDN